MGEYATYKVMLVVIVIMTAALIGSTFLIPSSIKSAPTQEATQLADSIFTGKDVTLSHSTGDTHIITPNPTQTAEIKRLFADLLIKQGQSKQLPESYPLPAYRLIFQLQDDSEVIAEYSRDFNTVHIKDAKSNKELFYTSPRWHKKDFGKVVMRVIGNDWQKRWNE